MIEMKPLRLYSTCLFSKWGFNDGNFIESWINDFIGNKYYDSNLLKIDFTWYYDDKYFMKIDFKKVLHRLVELYLIPELEKFHKLGKLKYIGSGHNSTRIEMLDGKEINWYNIKEDLILNPQYVDIEFKQFIKLLEEEFDFNS